MILVKKNWLASIKVPIHARLFGANKTWRGLIVMPFFTLLGAFLSHLLESEELGLGFSQSTWWIFGLGLGFMYVLFELPNSYFKRRLGVAPGKQATEYKFIFIFLDHFDSATGVGLFYYFFMGIPLLNIAGAIFIGALVHLVVNYLLYLLKIRREPL